MNMNERQSKKGWNESVWYWMPYAHRCMTRQTRVLDSVSVPWSPTPALTHTSIQKHFCPVSCVYRKPQLDLALNLLFGTLKEAVDCDVIADLRSVGSVTMAPGVVAPATSPSTAAFSLLLMDRWVFSWIFFICDLHHFKIPVLWTRRFNKRLFKCIVIMCLLFAAILTALSSCAILCNNTLENKNQILAV